MSAATGVPASLCPGCGVRLPRRREAVYDGYFNCSPECWTVFQELMAAEFGSAALFGRVHQLSVDTYAVQHAGGGHPDKSVGVHLCGLYLAHEQGRSSPAVAPLLRRMAGRVRKWPHFPPPRLADTPTVAGVASAESPAAYVAAVREWSAAVWRGWSLYHRAVAELVELHLR